MKPLPAPSKKRLLSLAKLLTQTQQERITSAEISRLTGWTKATIRRDISLLELHNGVSNGYNVKKLQEEISNCLGTSQESGPVNCCVVGLTSLGLGILESTSFDDTKFKLVAGFDTNQNKLDLISSKIPLFPTLDLESTIRRMKIEYTILAVPDEKAQFMADRLVKYGIKGIINYTNTVLTLPQEIKVINTSPVFLLQYLLQ